MYCPQCGQQQASGIVRFCSRCGFPLDGVIHLLGTGGMLPVYHQSDEPVQISARRKGVKQGAILFLSGAVIVPILGAFASFSTASFPQLLAILAAIICFVGGPFRMLYAGLFEEGAPPRYPTYGPPPPVAAPPQFAPPRQHSALPPPPARGPSAWRKPNTAELANPPSVTENTTRLLDKEDRTER
ncbi:MAG TPA: hypothetical protein VJP89_14185 [Pyrinomonadaceae bacterium]|nr:hypothetical protein [Pyrinomonadaceae bacterium]